MKLNEWIENIIQSCTDDFHFEAIDKLIELYHERTKNEDLTSDLKMLRAKKWNEIHAIVNPELNK